MENILNEFKKTLLYIHSESRWTKYFQNINVTFQLKINGDEYTFFAYNNNIQNVVSNINLTDPIDFTLEGSKDTWNQIVDGKLHISQALHPFFNLLTLSGSTIKYQSNLFYIVHFIKALSEVRNEVQ